MFFYFLEDESIPISPSFQQLIELVLQFQFICSKISNEGEGRALGGEKDGSPQGKPFVTPGSAQI